MVVTVCFHHRVIQSLTEKFFLFRNPINKKSKLCETLYYSVVNLYLIYFGSELNPSLFSPLCTSGWLMNSFQISPVR
ncbi:hypothetical protein EE52_002600 [Bacteroides fragilis]|nr:hypothetical protein EE52_002600 [Bacteroides fragilis]